MRPDRSGFRAKSEPAKQWQQWRLKVLGPAGSRSELAARLHVCKNTLSRYENGQAPAWYRYAIAGLALELGTIQTADQARELLDVVAAGNPA